jgi:hypothetical protein
MPAENTFFVSGLVAYQDIFSELYFSRFVARIESNGTLSIARAWNEDTKHCPTEKE